MDRRTVKNKGISNAGRHYRYPCEITAMKKAMSKKQIGILIGLIITVVITPVATALLFRFLAVCKPSLVLALAVNPMEAILAYLGGALAFIGTMYLGITANRQNEELLKREDENYLANNACMVMVSSIEFCQESVPQLDWEEPMFLEGSSDIIEDIIFLHGTMKISFSGGYPVYGRIEYISNVGREAYTIPEKYSVLHLSKDTSEIEFLIAVPKDEEGDQLSDHMIHIRFSVISEKYVKTTFGTSAWMECSIDSEGMIEMSSEKEPTPVCKFLGSDRVAANLIELKNADKQQAIFY